MLKKKYAKETIIFKHCVWLDIIALLTIYRNTKTYISHYVYCHNILFTTIYYANPVYVR